MLQLPPLVPRNVLNYALSVTGARLVFGIKRGACVWSCVREWCMHDCGWKLVRLLVCWSVLSYALVVNGAVFVMFYLKEVLLNVI